MESSELKNYATDTLALNNLIAKLKKELDNKHIVTIQYIENIIEFFFNKDANEYILDSIFKEMFSSEYELEDMQQSCRTPFFKEIYLDKDEDYVLILSFVTYEGNRTSNRLYINDINKFLTPDYLEKRYEEEELKRQKIEEDFNKKYNEKREREQYEQYLSLKERYEGGNNVRN